MTELLTAAQMRAIEQAAIDSGDVTGLELMERAGRGVVEAIFEEWPELAKTSHRAVVLCGPGNNGGDGFVVARLLFDWGWEIEVFLYGEAGKLPPDARVNYERWLERGGVSSIADVQVLPLPEGHCNVVVDALFGTGLTRPMKSLETITEDLVEAFDNYFEFEHYPKIVSVDVPSGTCSDSARFLFDKDRIYPSDCIFADLTVTFHREKLCHHLDADFTECGKIKVVDIGLEQPQDVNFVSRVDCVGNAIRKTASDHKYHHGHALILSGPVTRTGAARLAARGALRIGAGLVTVGAPADALAEHAAQLNAVMLCEVGEAAALAEVLQDNRINALCLGPGLGVERVRALVVAALAVPAPEPGHIGSEEGGSGSGPGPRRGIVLDADALTAFAGNPQHLFDMLHKNCVLTPHGGEFARLFPDIAEKLNAPATKGPAYSKVDATREAAKRTGCVVLYKGPDTVIAAPDGRCAINSALYDRAAPWLATAGSGDVLAGFITGLLARGFAPMQAAETAAWLHVECALKFGPGLIAEDLPEQLPAIFRDLGV